MQNCVNEYFECKRKNEIKAKEHENFELTYELLKTFDTWNETTKAITPKRIFEYIDDVLLRYKKSPDLGTIKFRKWDPPKDLSRDITTFKDFWKHQIESTIIKKNETFIHCCIDLNLTNRTVDNEITKERQRRKRIKDRQPSKTVEQQTKRFVRLMNGKVSTDNHEMREIVKRENANREKHDLPSLGVPEKPEKNYNEIKNNKKLFVAFAEECKQKKYSFAESAANINVPKKILENLCNLHDVVKWQ